MSFTIRDNNNEPVLIESMGIYDFTVTWLNITKEFSNPLNRTLEEDDLTSIKNFQIGAMKGLLFTIDDSTYTIIYEPIDIRSTIDNEGYPIKFEISGPFGKRCLCVTWEIQPGIDCLSSCFVSDDTKTDDVNFIKILCNPQDVPHGVLVSIAGQKREALNYGESMRYRSLGDYDRRKLEDCHKTYMWQTIKSELGTDNDIETTLKILEHARLISILENKDSLNLAREIDKQNSIIKKLNLELVNVKDSLAILTEENKSLKDNLEKLQIYKNERNTFKKDLMQKLSDVLKQSTLV